MSYLLVDNTTNLNNAIMTPLIIEYFKKKKIKLIVTSDKKILETKVLDKNLKGIILSGGPILLSDLTLLKDYILNLTIIIKYPTVPILGICFGFQIISMVYGGYIDKLEKNKMDLFEEINIINKDSLLYHNFKKEKINVYQYHNDYIKEIPSDFEITALDNNKIIQSIENKEKMRFGTQFHPENTDDGKLILNNFILFCENIFSKKKID